MVAEKKINFKKNIQNALLSFQKIYGYSQANLSEKIGLNALTIKGYLSNNVKAQPSIESLLKITDFFGVSLDYLLLESKNPFVNSVNLFRLGEKIDEAHEFSSRYQLEATISLYLHDHTSKSKFDSNYDKLFLSHSINDNIKKLRNSKKEYTQEIFAKQIGLQRTHISQYERNVKPPFEILIKISKLFNISVHYFVTGQPCNFKFNNSHLLDKLLVLDNLANFDNIKIITDMMQKILNQKIKA